MSRLRIACGCVVLLGVIALSGWGAIAALPLRIDEMTVLPLPKPGEPGAVSLLPIDAGLQSLSNLTPKNQDSAATQQAKERMAETIANLQVLATFAELQGASEAHHRAMDAARAFHQGTLPGVPTVTQKVAPVYPEAARGHGVEAVVHVRVTVGMAGEVTNVEVLRTRLTTERDVTDPGFWASQPSKLFGQAAEDAVRQWRFEPGSAVRRFEVPVPFGEDQMAFVPIGSGGRGGVQGANRTPSVVARAEPIAAQGDKPARIRVGGAIRQPHQVSNVAPVYPPAAEAANVQGVVILELVTGTDGTVIQATVLRSIPLLDQAALDAVTQWRYEPTLLNGAPVEVIMVVTVNFTLAQ
jgi:TonB family protein